MISSLQEFWPITHQRKSLEDIQRKVYNYLFYALVITFVLPYFIELILPVILNKDISRGLITSEIFFVSPYYELIYVAQLFDYHVSISLVIGLQGIYFFLVIFCYFQLKMLNSSIQELDFKDVLVYSVNWILSVFHENI